MNEGFCVAEVLFDEHNKPIDYRLLEINSVFEKHSGLKDAQGKTARELHPELEQYWIDLYGNVVLTGEPVRYENHSEALNRWFDVSSFRIEPPESRKVAILFEDISDRKRSEVEHQQVEEALRESENRLRLALESAELGTWDFNPLTNVLKWDDRCKAMFGLPPSAEITWDVFLAGLHPEDRDRTHQVVLQSFNPEGGGDYDIEYRTVGLEDGIERWVAAKGKAFFNSAGGVIRFIGTVLNITEKKRAEAEREQLLQREQAARAEAERANRIKDEFLAVLSHELRSPLNPILGWTKLLQTRKLDETKTAEALATIERNARVQTQLIDDLLDVAKILRGKLSLNVNSVNLSSAIEAAIDTVRTAAVAKSISLHPVLPNIGQVSGDAARLQQIVWNLLSNAIKFTPNGGRVDIQLDRVGNQAEITVRDTGRGINPDFLPHIFESFRQEDGSITRQYGGLGLGLAIVRQLVEAHGGTITADSPGEGLGAAFTVRLPLLDVAPEIQQTDELPQKKLDLTGIRVLAVDDDPDARELLTVLLSQYGADVLTVASAVEVLANLASFQPDVLVSDIGMPEVDGYTLIQQVRALPSAQGGQIRAIALSAYAREDDRDRAISSGFQRHVIKPLEPEQLVQAVLTLTRSELNHSMNQNYSV
jgi:PAS domain S-box-containing protein